MSLERAGDMHLMQKSFHSYVDAIASFNEAKQKLYHALHDESIVDDVPYPHFKTSDMQMKSWYDQLISKLKLSTEKMRIAAHEA